MRESSGPEHARLVEAVKLYVTAQFGRPVLAPELAAVLAITAYWPLVGLDGKERLLRSLVSRELYELRLQSGQWREALPVSWLDLVSADGFERERALQSLSGPAPDAFWLTVMMRRLNDWVPEVRAACQAKLREVALASDPQAVVAALVVTFSHWLSWRQLDEDSRAAALQLLDSAAVLKAFVDRLHRSGAGPNAHCLAQANGAGALDPHLKQLASEAVQPAVRATACRWLMDGEASWVLKSRWVWTDKNQSQGRWNREMARRPLQHPIGTVDAMRIALNDPSPLVRRAVADRLIRALEHSTEPLTELAHRLATDPEPSIAERGRFALSRCAILKAPQEPPFESACDVSSPGKPTP